MVQNNTWGGRTVFELKGGVLRRRNFSHFPTRGHYTAVYFGTQTGNAGIFYWTLQVHYSSSLFTNWISVEYPDQTGFTGTQVYVDAWTPPDGFRRTSGNYWNLVLRPQVWSKFTQSTVFAWRAAH